MPWNEPGGNKDPWSGKKKKSSSKSGNLNNPADKVTELFASVSDGGGGKFLWLLPILAIALWLFSGIYTIDAGQRGVVLHFGQFKEITNPGLHWIPKPIDKVEVVDIDRNRSADDHSTMLTKDENIVDLRIEVQYLVTDPKNYLFNVMNADYEPNQQRGVLYQVMRSAVREVVGRNDMDFIIQTGREQIEIDTHELMQNILDEYNMGLRITKINLKDAIAPEEVKDAFDDANRAKVDFERSKNRGEIYANKVVPDARGKAARALEEANAYKEQVIAKAEGDASRFVSLAKEYNKAPEVTRERLYLDTMEQVMAGSKKIMMDTSSSNNMFYLPITGDTNSTSSMSSVPPPISGEMIDRLKKEAQAKQSRSSNRSSTRGGR